jgi:phage tail protein X
MTERVVSEQGDLLDAMVWRHYGSQVATVEAVLAANSGLAARGAIYPSGVEVRMPALDLRRVPVRDWTRLW